ncbi:uncharacterized protein LOC111099830 [Crassostrea virginica]
MQGMEMEDFMATETVKSVMARGFQEIRVRKAVERVIFDKNKCPEEITEQMIIHEIEEMRREELRTENAELQAMLLCKRCKINRITCVNVGCNDPMCDVCSGMGFCGVCGMAITELIHFKLAQ